MAMPQQAVGVPSSSSRRASIDHAATAIAIDSSSSATMGVSGNTKAAPVPSLPLLTLSMLGVQCVWSVEMAFGAPFLLHLGLQESHMALVLLAGPLSGLLVQPCIGLISDASTSKWGRRRPLLLLSCLTCFPAILAFGFARPLSALLSSDLVVQARWTLVIAIVSVFVVDFSINAVGALDRALVLDLVPSYKQKVAHAWCARMSGFGAIVGYFISQVELVNIAPFRWFPSLSYHTDATEVQVRCVCLLAAIFLALTHSVTMVVARETPVAAKRGTLNKRGPALLLHKLNELVVDLVTTAKTLSRPIIHIFRIQLFLQSAWYPILFYSTTWISQIAIGSSKAGQGDESEGASIKTLIDQATALRMGSQAFLISSILSLLCSIFVPALMSVYNKRVSDRSFDSLGMLLAISAFVLSLALMTSRICTSTGSVGGAMTVIAITGFPWSLNIWGPSALLGILIRKESEKQQYDIVLQTSSTEAAQDTTATGMAAAPTTSTANTSPATATATATTAAAEERHALMRHSGDHDEEDEGLQAELDAWNDDDGEDDEEEEGQDLEYACHSDRAIGNQPSRGATIFGLYNVSIVLPQFLMTLISTIIFGIMEHGKEKQDDNVVESGDQILGSDVQKIDLALGSSEAIVLILQIGGLFALVAGLLTIRFAKEHMHAVAG